MTADQPEQPDKANTRAKGTRAKKVGPREAARILAERDPVIAGLFAEFGAAASSTYRGTATSRRWSGR